MRTSWLLSASFLSVIVIFSLILFSPGFSTYFHQDDFIHMWYSQTPKQVISAFNIFQKSEFPFYRPIPTQLYFYFGNLIFGLNPIGYHIVNFIIFTLNTILVDKVVIKISNKIPIGLLSALIYAVNSTHIAPLYSPAYVHELFYVFFGLLTCIAFIKSLTSQTLKWRIISIVFFIAALMTKENAVALPAVLFLLFIYVNDALKIKSGMIFLLPYFIIETVYLVGHFFFYGLAESPSYTIIIGKQTINILFWFFLWALSSPNILIDFIGPGLKMNQVFFQVAGHHALIFFFLFPLFLVSLLLIIIASLNQKERKKIVKPALVGIFWFTFAISPLLPFPLHKLATEQAFSLIGLSLVLSVLWYQALGFSIFCKLVVFISIVLYLALASNSIILARKTHWIALSARQAENTISFLSSTHPDIQTRKKIIFIDGELKIPQYGSSRQIYQALGNGLGLKIMLGNPDLEVKFEFKDSLDNIHPDDLVIDSSQLLGY